MELQISEDGKLALNPENEWIYHQQFDGRWVLLRKATCEEINHAREVRKRAQHFAAYALNPVE